MSEIKNNEQLHRVGSSEHRSPEHRNPKPNKPKKKKRRVWRVVRLILLILLIMIAFAAIYLVAGGYASKIIAMHDEAVQLVANSSEETFEASRSSFVYDKDGNELAELGGKKKIQYVTSDKMPKQVKEAFVAIEDKSFYRHPGVSLKGIARAALAMVRNHKVSGGGSTITQQLARTVFLTQDKTWERKVEEIFVALEMEKKYSKDQILNFYINNVYFMNGFYGIGTASQGYFSKDIGELSLAEITYLCAIPNRPSYYDPINHPENTVVRQTLILKNMLKDKKISQEEYAQATGQQVTLNLSQDQKEFHNYETTFAEYSAVRALMTADGFDFQYQFNSDDERKAYEDKYGKEYDSYASELYTGGYKIYTSLDANLQQSLQTAVDKNMSKLSETTDKGIYAAQSAGTVIDNTTGNVVAIVGGRSQDNITTYTLNRAYRSYRQPGSSIKPILVYTPALETGKYTPDTRVQDAPITNGPQNYGNSYMGNVTLTQAVAYSLNTVAWKVFKDVKPAKGLQYLYKMHFAEISKNDENLAAGIGGLTNGVTTVEMASAYAALENDGKYREPTCIDHIDDKNGNTIYRNNHAETQIYKSDAAHQMITMMKAVLDYGTGAGLKLSNQVAAAKSGTTNDYKDGWFCGFTPYYTTAIWTGYDTPRSMQNLTGANYPGRIWRDFMTAAHKKLTYKNFSWETSKTSSDSKSSGSSSSQGTEGQKEDKKNSADSDSKSQTDSTGQESPASEDSSSSSSSKGKSSESNSTNQRGGGETDSPASPSSGH